MNKRDTFAYNERFIKSIRTMAFDNNDDHVKLSESFRDMIEEHRVRPKGPVRLLGKDGTWLSKELDKWKNKITNNTFNGTLQNLEVFCEITKSSPNNILLDKEELIESGGLEVVFLSKKTIIEIAKQLFLNPSLLEYDLILPVKSRPERLFTLFIKFYRSKDKKDILAMFMSSEYDEEDGIVTTSYENIDSRIINITSPNISAISIENAIELAEKEYRDSCASLRADISYYMEPINDLTIKKDDDLLFSLIIEESENEEESENQEDIKLGIDGMINAASNTR